MPQYFQDASGKMHEFPDDATPEEIDSATKLLPRKAVRGGKPMAETRSNNVGMAKPVYPTANEMLAKRYSGYRDFGNAAAHWVGNVPVTAGQLVANTAGLLPVPALKENADTYNKFVAQREAQYQKDTPDNAASYAGAIAGNVALLGSSKGVEAMDALASVGKILPKGKGLLAIPRIALGGATQGAALGALTPDTSGDYSDKGNQVIAGAATGGLLPAGLLAGAKSVDSIAGAIRYAKNPDKVAADKLAQWYGKDPETIAKLRNAPRFFDGEQVTAAQALQTPNAFAVEKALGNQAEFKIMSEEIKNANNALRVGVVEDIAQTPEAKALAIKARKEATDPFYKEFVNPVSQYTRYNTASSVLDSAKGKRMSAEDFDAIDRAGKIVRSVRDGRRTEEEAAKLLSEITAKSATAQKALEQATAAVGKNMIDAGRIEKQLRSLTLDKNGTVRAFAVEQLGLLAKLKEQFGGKIPIANLQGIQQELSNSFNTAAASNGFDKSGQYVLGRLNAKFNSALDRAAPGYRDNSRLFAQMSQPLNDMEAGTALLSRGDGRVLNTAGEAPLSLADINRAIGDNGKARYGLSDEALARITALRESLKREGTTIKSAGSDTAYNLNADGWVNRAIYGGGDAKSMAGNFGLPIAGGYLGNALAPGGMGMAVGSAAGTGAAMGLNSKVTAINSRIASEAARGVYDSRVAADMIEQVLNENPNQARALLERFPYWKQLITQP